jgi:hypothetical protein
MTTKLLVALLALFTFTTLAVAQDRPEGGRPERARRGPPVGEVGRQDGGPMREQIRELVREAVREALAEEMPGARRDASRTAPRSKQGIRAQRGHGTARFQRDGIARRFPGLRARGWGIAMRSRAMGGIPMRGPQFDRGEFRGRMEQLRGRLGQMRERMHERAPAKGRECKRPAPQRPHRAGDREPV